MLSARVSPGVLGLIPAGHGFGGTSNVQSLKGTSAMPAHRRWATRELASEGRGLLPGSRGASPRGYLNILPQADRTTGRGAPGHWEEAELLRFGLWTLDVAPKWSAAGSECATPRIPASTH